MIPDPVESQGRIKKYFHADLTDPVHYDLNLNTTQYTVEAAGGIVKDTRP